MDYQKKVEDLSVALREEADKISQEDAVHVVVGIAIEDEKTTGMHCNVWYGASPLAIVALICGMLDENPMLWPILKAEREKTMETMQ